MSSQERRARALFSSDIQLFLLSRCLLSELTLSTTSMLPLPEAQRIPQMSDFYTSPNELHGITKKSRGPFSRTPAPALTLQAFLDLGYLLRRRTPRLAVDGPRRLGARGLH